MDLRIESVLGARVLFSKCPNAIVLRSRTWPWLRPTGRRALCECLLEWDTSGPSRVPGSGSTWLSARAALSSRGGLLKIWALMLLKVLVPVIFCSILL